MAAPIERVVGVSAAGASAAPTPMYGDYLATHGIWLLSYAEWLQVLGGLYVATLLIKMCAGWIQRRGKK
jgi:hypothetical protein